jgi:hypothetical protein
LAAGSYNLVRPWDADLGEVPQGGLVRPAGQFPYLSIAVDHERTDTGDGVEIWRAATGPPIAMVVFISETPSVRRPHHNSP